MKKIAFLTMLCLMLAVFINSCEPFIEPPKHFSVVFHANGGKGSMKMQIMNMGNEESLKLSPNTFTRDGYVFTGWNTEATGKGRVFKDRQIISSHENLSLYAQWKSAGSSGSSTTENGHEWVDLGLPSGLKWATCNVGASTPEGYGSYFAWGETSPKQNYDWSTYKYWNGSSSTLTKYNTDSSRGSVDNKTTLEHSDDAARANWGGEWRMPTQVEQQELINNCTWTWTTRIGINGYKVTSKTNGNSIFLPAAGFRDGASVNGVGSYGYYWSSSLYEGGPGNACNLYFYSGDVDWYCIYRYYGLTVRAVCGDNTAAQTFTLTFNANGGTGTMAAQTFEAGVSQAIKANTFTRSGYTFTGWNTKADGSGTSYADKQSITLSQNITLYAQWKKDIVNYTLTFNANGGTGTMAAQTFEAGVSQAIAANAFTRSGYTFTGWNTKADGSGNSYTDGQEIALSQDITLYAQWNQEQVVSGTENGHDYVDLGLPSGLKWATCNVGATTPDGYGDYFAWGETSPKDNYDWSTYKYCNGSSSSLTKYNTKNTLGTVDNKIKLDLSDDAARVNWGGKWRMPTKAEQDELDTNCTITWTTQNGVSGYNVTSKINGKSIFLPAAGYRNGTSVVDIGDKSLYWPSSLYETNPTCAYFSSIKSSSYGSRSVGRTVRAVFSDNDKPSTFVTLTFNANGGTGTMAAQTFEAGVSQAIAANAFTRSGYTFTGWNTAANGSGTSYTDKQSITLSQNITLYAQWKKDIVNYTLTFNANGGTGTMAAQTFEAGVSQAIAANAFTRSGYTFTGWNTNADGSGTSYTDGQEITLSQDITLYAQWKKDIVNYIIIFNANGGSGTMAAQIFEAGVSQAIKANTFTRSGYTFTGWNTKADGSGTSYTDKQSITISQNITLYAQWKKDIVNYTVTFNANGGTGTMAAQTFEAGISQALAANKFTRDGYTFAGWNTAADGSGTSYTDGQEITLTQDITLYAQWNHKQVVSGTENGHDYVDLGLPSGLKWATCNVGATTPEGYGDYFAWGETETEPKTNYGDFSTYKYCNGSSNTMTKYCTNSRYGYNGFTDGKTTLELSDDAARANWGGTWRMPTEAEQNELRNNCTWTWSTQNGVNGYKVTSKTNGNSIFLPAAGFSYDGTSVSYVGSGGYYWSSSLHEKYPYYACYLSLRLDNDVYLSAYHRFSGQSVRAVCP